MNFNKKTPCKDCPFRTDIKKYLPGERVEEIVGDIVDMQGTFTCHKTNDYSDSDDGGVVIETKDSEHCAGALIMLEKMDHPNQLMRVAERIGCYDRRKLDMDAPVYDDGEDMIYDYYSEEEN